MVNTKLKFSSTYHPHGRANESGELLLRDIFEVYEREETKTMASMVELGKILI